MTSLFDKLNLRPGERRLVVIVAGVVFVVLNFWLAFPHFGDLGRVQQQTKDAKKKLNAFMEEINRQPQYQKMKDDLAKKGGVVAEDSRDLELQKEVSSQALASGVMVQTYRSTDRVTSGGKTNVFFDEKGLIITGNTGERELIDFLFNLAERNSLIRVRSMTLNPDPTRMRLVFNLTFVASYQKQKPPSKAAVVATTPTPPLPKPVSASSNASASPVISPASSASSSSPPPKPGAKPTNAPATRITKTTNALSASLIKPTNALPRSVTKPTNAPPKAAGEAAKSPVRFPEPSPPKPPE